MSTRIKHNINLLQEAIGVVFMNENIQPRTFNNIDYYCALEDPFSSSILEEKSRWTLRLSETYLIALSLTEEEAIPVQLKAEDLTDCILGCEASVYVKVLFEKDGFVSIQGFNLAISKAWNCKILRVTRIAGPLLHVFFASVKERDGVIG
ncbi:hypothetical protein LIER_32537 [Lithospermum erythrorhizon]|uniref:Uncharacterized protein n=1 Tax=Lithospermum erythrorhizon TaxID=34254 RepID=A0AAV3RWC1_LITER